MHRMRHGYLIAGFLVWMAIGTRSSDAQFSANFQTNLISGVTNNWFGDYLVGSNTFSDVLLIRSKGVLSIKSGPFRIGFVYMGYEVGGSNNTAIVTGAGSLWDSSGNVWIGYHGGGNSLIISNGGQVSDSTSSYITLGASSSSNRVIVTGTGSVWRDNYTLYVGGMSGEGNRVVVDNGGLLISETAWIGEGSTSSNNSVVVTGSGSVWSNGFLTVGYFGGGNSLIISNGGSYVGRLDSVVVGQNSSGNCVLVTGPGSILSNRALYVGDQGTANSLVINNSGQVIDVGGYVGHGSSVSNTARVVGGGVWQNNSLYVGSAGSGNSLVVDGGSVYATNLIVGTASTTCDNVLELDSGSVIITNSTGTGVLEVRNGELIFSGGTLQADTLVMKNPCASFIHTGGTVIIGSVMLDPNTFRIVSVARQSNDLLVTWMMGPGATNALQVTTGGVGGSYNTNGFTDIFVVTNNTTIGTVTNYLDIGAATNVPSRYYRARLVP